MKKIFGILIIVLLSGSIDLLAQDKAKGGVEALTVEGFKEKVYNWEENPEKWVFKGSEPVVVDFYADWCRPCKMIAPIMEELANDYKGKIKIYKVNTDKNKELSRLFEIRSIPSILFVPMDGEPQMTKGAMQKADYKKIFDEFLLGEKPKK